jgi:hypothetical protein
MPHFFLPFSNFNTKAQNQNSQNLVSPYNENSFKKDRTDEQVESVHAATAALK